MVMPVVVKLSIAINAAGAAASPICWPISRSGCNLPPLDHRQHLRVTMGLHTVAAQDF